MTNHIAEVAKLLGVELMENFKIADDIFGEHPKYYRFAENVCLEASKDSVNWETADTGVLEDILLGDVMIIKLPWKPQKGETYYIPCIVAEPEYMYSVNYWSNDDYDKEYYRMGLVCKTSEEAVALTKKIISAVQEEKKEWAVT